MQVSGKTTTFGAAGLMLALGGMMLTPTAAQASADGRRNTAIGIGAVAAIELLRGRTTEGLILGAGAAYAAKLYEDDRRAERDRNDRRYHQQDYGDNGRSSDSSHDYDKSSGDYDSGNRNGSSYGDVGDGGDYETYSGDDPSSQQMTADSGSQFYHRRSRRSAYSY